MTAIKTLTVAAVIILVLWVSVLMFAHCDKYQWQDPLAQSNGPGQIYPGLGMRRSGYKPGQTSNRMGVSIMLTIEDRLLAEVKGNADTMLDYLHGSENDESADIYDILYTYGVQDGRMVLRGIRLVVAMNGPHIEIELPSGKVFGYWGGCEPQMWQGKSDHAIQLWDCYSETDPVTLGFGRR